MVLHPLEAGQIQAHLTKSHRRNLLNSLLRSLSLSHAPEKALHVFRHILHLSPPSSSDHFAYTFLLRAASLLHPDHGLQLHARLLNSGLHADLFVQNSLIGFYTSAADVDSVRRVFAGIARPDVVCWTSFVSALARCGREDEALAAFRSMDVPPNALTLVSLLPACARLGALLPGKAVHGFGLKSCGGHGCNVILDNAILDLYMSCRDLVSARNLFGEMPSKDVVSWTTLISGYAANGIPEEAISAFHVMLRHGQVEPNEATMACVLRACASLGALSTGKWIHSYLLKSHIGVCGLPGNALINMYAKCGVIVMAWRAFSGLACRDLVSWCTMMGGLAMTSRSDLALQLFASMICHGLRPDGVAFLALLSACCHAGLLDQGLMIFKAMSKVYGVVPKKEHYTCMMDAFSRAGRLKEAEGILCSMPVEPDKHVWGVLLSACKTHGLQQAEWEHLGGKALGGYLDFGGGTYALVSNILADAGRWEVSNHVRDLMRVRKVEKTVGCSRIEGR
ncbi:unnamed protein product [Musa acuminata subsp. malaccensis]|uniref:(wild Malaysian banana) hypothetical protein n=1 Tax=Musa acuminata subsp. malaccensis TaxID=214687 RepID=A0A804JKT7_MUSAM|nr:PREDICTED: pentatricopeptide repeat-containing protein At4g38010-like [Musa acuminata subsp. malaccensis]CAG1847500.1 unnamed protein product [Musa acuminata subsp. malaccensis]